MLMDSLRIAGAYQQPLPADTLVFTDDRAPIELITNEMVLNFVLFGDVESLR